MIHQAVSLSRYSECAVPLLHLTKLNTTFLCSGFFGFTASTRRPHPAAVPVRSARSPQPKTCIALDLQLWAWKNPLCQVFPLPQNRIRTSLWSSKRLHLRCYLWEVFLGVWGGGRELGGALDKLNFHMDMWGLTCFLWVVPQKFSFTGFWAPHKETSRPTEKQIHSTRRTTPAVGPRCHPPTLKTLIWKPFACCLYWLTFRSLCWEPSVVCHLFSLHFLPHIVVGFFFCCVFFKDSIHFFGYRFLFISWHWEGSGQI